MKKEPKINPDLVIHTEPVMIMEHKDKPEKPKRRQIRILKEDVHPNKQNQNIYCKYCEHYYFDWANHSRSLQGGYSPMRFHYCKRNVVDKFDPIGDRIDSRGEDCLMVNANLDCKDFEQKRKWYQRKKRT